MPPKNPRANVISLSEARKRREMRRPALEDHGLAKYGQLIRLLRETDFEKEVIVRKGLIAIFKEKYLGFRAMLEDLESLTKVVSLAKGILIDANTKTTLALQKDKKVKLTKSEVKKYNGALKKISDFRNYYSDISSDFFEMLDDERDLLVSYVLESPEIRSIHEEFGRWTDIFYLRFPRANEKGIIEKD
jgi:hypothetical protein